MKSWFKKLLRKNNNISPLITVSISKSALIHNLNEFRRISMALDTKSPVAPVLKSNAYGHGLVLIAKVLKDEKISFLVIDSYFEARHLRNEGIKTPLLIIGYSNIETILENDLKDVRFTITSIDTLKELENKISGKYHDKYKNKIKSNKKITIHLKIDTGMHRQGILFEEIDTAFNIIKKSRNIILEGICSHLADADSVDSRFTDSQISVWNKIVDETRKHFPSLLYWHISNTAGHSYKDAKANLTRLGIGLYGIKCNTDYKTNHIEKIESSINLMPVLEMTTYISEIKKIKKGKYVGYNCTFKAPQDMTIATIPVGYYEGIDRRLSNKGVVKIDNYFAPIIGRVSMNITIIDVSNIPDVKRGDEVIVISKNTEDRNSIKNIAKDCGTIPYEIAVHIPAHLRREVVE